MRRTINECEFAQIILFALSVTRKFDQYKGRVDIDEQENPMTVLIRFNLFLFP